MKQRTLVSIVLVLFLSLLFACVCIAETEPLIQLTFDSEDEDFILNGNAVVEDGVVKLPGGDMRTAYVELPYAALIDTTDNVTFSTWIYIPADSDINTYFVSFSNGNTWPAFTGRVLPSGQVTVNFDNRGVLITEPVFPTDGWVHTVLSISKYQMALYLNGSCAALYDGTTGVCDRCGWYKINGADVGTTHYHELDKINLPSGYLGTPTYNFYYELEGDSQAMFDDYRIYDIAMNADEVKTLYESLTCPAAAWPIGAAAIPNNQPAEVVLPESPADDLRVYLTYDSEDEMYSLYNNAKIEKGVLRLPGGSFRETGHLELPDYAIVNCADAMTFSTWINFDNFSIGDQFIFAISSGEAWPAIYLMTWGDGSLHYNIDYRSMLNSDYKLPAGKWVYLTAVISAQEVTLYADGQEVTRYDRNAIKTTGGTWEMLNVQNDFTQYCEIDRVANKTFRIGSAFMDIGYNRVDAAARLDNTRIYSRALNAQDVQELYNRECEETGYNK